MSEPAAHSSGGVAQGRRLEHAGPFLTPPAGQRPVGLVVHGAGPMQSGTLEGVLRSCRNAVEALGPEIPVEAVIQGPGVALLAAGAESGGAVEAAIASGVQVLACGNSLRSAGLSEGGLLPGIDVVPAAIAHLARRQWEGWAYVRI